MSGKNWGGLGRSHTHPHCACVRMCCTERRDELPVPQGTGDVGKNRDCLSCVKDLRFHPTHSRKVLLCARHGLQP